MKTLVSDDRSTGGARRLPQSRVTGRWRRSRAPNAGCPWDCGLCPDHEQHSCLAIVEINEACNLACPVCFADSSPKRDACACAGSRSSACSTPWWRARRPDLVQISGGEPTIHPQIPEILAAARRRPIRHVMLNTNGIRIAEDLAFVDALAGCARASRSTCGSIR